MKGRLETKTETETNQKVKGRKRDLLMEETRRWMDLEG